jgi:hypothetical protein
MVNIDICKTDVRVGLSDSDGYVESGAITPDEYKQITGNDYAAGANA